MYFHRTAILMQNKYKPESGKEELIVVSGEADCFIFRGRVS